jgi:serine/threonine protein kinase
LSQDPANEFLDSARQSGLLSTDEAATLSRDMRDGGAATSQDVAAKLVKMDVLTAFQAEQLLAGRGAECVLAGRYLLRQKLGAGAMGAVFLAVDKKLDRAVAIKMLPSQSVTDAGAVARFQREAKALAKLSHPNIIQAYDSDEDAGRQFLVMEYAEGTNLGELVRAKGRIAPALAADYVYQAALGLQNAHEKALVHRDLKPGNLLLTPHGQVKILDLGLARFLQDQVGDATLTREGTGMGTPDYMPPEQFHDARHVDARSDIYSLGCTLYHLITGRVPFPGTSMSAKYAAHEQHEPPPLEEFCPDVPAGLALVVQRMMAKRPADRFQSAREVAEAVFPHVAGSSHAILHIKGTVSWHGSQLGLSVEPLRVRRRRQLIFGSAMTASALAVVALVLWAGGAFGPKSTDGGGDANQPTVTDNRKSEPRPSGTVGSKRESPKPVEFPKEPTTVKLDDWQILADATLDEMQTWLDARKESGHSVMWLDCVQVGEVPVFAAVASLDNRATGWKAFLDLPEAEINDAPQLAKRIGDSTFLVTSLSGYAQENEIRCAAVIKPGKPPFLIGVMPMEIVAVNLTRTDAQGYVARLVRPFPVSGDQLRCGLYGESHFGMQSKYGLNLAEAELLERLEENRKDGYLPISVAAYPTQGELRFAATFRENTTKAVWEVHRNLTAADLSAKAEALAEKRFTPAAVTACPWDGAVRYCGVWVKEPPRPVEFPQQATFINQPGWETIVDASKDEMEKWLAERKAAKHSVVWLDSVLVVDRPLFFAVAALDDRQPDWIALLDFPSDDFTTGPVSQRIDFKAQSPLSASGFSAHGKARCTTLWVADGAKYSFFPNVSAAQHDEVNKMLRDHVGMLKFVRPYVVEGGGILSGWCWALGEFGPTSSLALDATASTMFDFVQARRDAGDLITSLAAYPKDGQLLYAVVAGSNPKKIEWHIEHDLTVDQFKARNAERAQQGFRPANVTACPWDGAVRYAVVWVKEPVNQK